MVQYLEQEFFGGMFLVLEMPWKELCQVENFDQHVGVLRVSLEEEEVGTDCLVENVDQNVGVLRVSLEGEEVGTGCPSSSLPHKGDCSALCPCLSSQFPNFGQTNLQIEILEEYELFETHELLLDSGGQHLKSLAQKHTESLKP